ncbi:MAG TPA: hypothetical protein VI248_26305, partial [Kineosporiaceae bacterium]
MIMNPARRPGGQAPGIRKKALALIVLVAGALVPALVAQAQANALSVFCVGPDWSDGSGGTMAGSQYPSPISTKIRDDVWHTGSEGETRLVKA